MATTSFFALALHLLVLLWTGFDSATSSATVALGKQMTLSWLVTEDQLIMVHVSANCKCWVGIGWHAAGASDDYMTKTDFVIATFDNGPISVADYFSTPEDAGYHKPLLDTDPTIKGYNNILHFSGNQTDTVTTFTFLRQLVTNDTNGDHPITNADMKVNWAHGSSNEFKYHGPNNRGQVIVNFISGAHGNSSSSSDTKKFLHGSLMTISFGFCMAFGIFVSRFLKSFYWWFPLHITTQVSSALLALSGFIVALVMVNGIHFTTLHSWFGVTTLSLTIISISGGIASHLAFNVNRTVTPVWPDKIHWWIARLTIAFGWTTIFLGLRQFGASPVFLVMFGLLIAIYLVIYFCVDFATRPNSHFSINNKAPLEIAPLLHH